MSGAAQVLMAELWERESKAGNRYFSGYLGKAQLLLFKDGERPHPTRPDETIVVWKLLLQERDQGRQAGAGRPQARGDRARRAPTPAETERAERWTQERGETPFYDDTEAAVTDLEGRGS